MEGVARGVCFENFLAVQPEEMIKETWGSRGDGGLGVLEVLSIGVSGGFPLHLALVRNKEEDAGLACEAVKLFAAGVGEDDGACGISQSSCEIGLLFQTHHFGPPSPSCEGTAWQQKRW